MRLLGISLIGDIGGTGASDILLDVLSQSEDPDIKIEILIALGKMKETRAVYVMEQLANDPTDVVAFTAQEVLQKLAREKGIKLSSELKMRPVAMPESTAIAEEKIPVLNVRDTMSVKAKNMRSQRAQKWAADSVQAMKGGKPAKTAPAIDSAKTASVNKTRAGDSLAVKAQSSPDDVWGVQAVDSSKTGAAKNTPSQSSATDTSALKRAAGDTTALAGTAEKYGQSQCNAGKAGCQEGEKHPSVAAR